MKFRSRSKVGLVYATLAGCVGCAMAITSLPRVTNAQDPEPGAMIDPPRREASTTVTPQAAPATFVARVDALLLSPRPISPTTIGRAPRTRQSNVSDETVAPAPPRQPGAASPVPLPRRVATASMTAPSSSADHKAAPAGKAAKGSSEIPRIKRALKLRPDQEPYWQPVEAILRDIERQQRLAGRDFTALRANPDASLDPNKVQQLTSAAFPLIMSLDEGQRREARALARSMGLENVAAAI